MNLNNNDFVIRLLLFVETLIFSFACLMLFILLPEDFGAVIVVANIGIVSVIFTFSRYRQRRKMKIYINNMIRNLDNIFSGNDDNFMVVMEDSQMAEYYSKIQEIREKYKNKEFNRKKVLNIVNSVAMNMEIEKLLEDLMPKLTDVTNSNCGAFYLANSSTNKLEIKHSIGFSKNIYSEFDLVLGEGLLGNAAVNKKIQIIKNLPEDSVYIMRTFLGKIKPKSIMVVPIINQDQLLGVFAFASLSEYSDMELELVNLVKYYVGAAVGNSLIFEKTRRLTNELKFQNRLIQNLNDDLEKKVQERTIFLNDTIDAINDYAIYVTDKDGIILFWNKASENLFEKSAKDIIGKHINEIYTEEDVKSGYVQKIIYTVMNKGKYMENGWCLKKDGTKYYAQKLLFARYDKNGEVVGFTNITKDITTLKNIEGSLYLEKTFSQKLIDDSSGALIFTNESGVINNLNPKARDIFGGNLVLGQKIYSLFEKESELEQNVKIVLENLNTFNGKFQLKNSDIHIIMNLSILVNEITSSKILFFQFYE